MERLRVLTYFVLLCVLCSNGALEIDIQFNGKQLYIGDKCTAKYNGTCAYVNTCNVDEMTICGYEGEKPIVCCPDQDIVNRKSDTLGDVTAPVWDGYLEFTDECITGDTKESGRLMQEQYCPTSIAGAKLPRGCPFELCYDIVCCPNSKRNRLAQVCVHENPKKLLQIRLQSNFECTIHDTNSTGIITELLKCPSYNGKTRNVNTDRLCDWDICESHVCCPKINPEKIQCTSHDDWTYLYIQDVGANACIMKRSNRPGTCMTRSKCLSIEWQSPDYQLCGRDCCSDFICCPDPILTDLSPSERACARFRDTVYESKRTIREYEPSEVSKVRSCFAVLPSGGFLATPKEFPHMAVLGYKSNDSRVHWVCGGTLISDRFILTAGHCLSSKEFGRVKYVRLGILDLNVEGSNPREDCPEEFAVEKIIPHPAYTTRREYNDIALLRLDRTVQFNPNIRPACLSDSDDLKVDQSLIAIGFGLTGWAENRTEQLIKVYLSYFAYEQCNKSYEFYVNRRLPHGIIDETQFCAGSIFGIQDTCPGDSGGPIQVMHAKYYNMAKVVGVTSFGIACGIKNSPGVYTRIYPYLKWIESVVWPDDEI